LYPSPNIISYKVKEVEMGGACSIYREGWNPYRVFMGNSGKRALRRPTRRLYFNMKIDFR
jgi:hypothetical protein